MATGAGEKLKAQVLFRRKTVPDELNDRPEDDIDCWVLFAQYHFCLLEVAENGNTTDETMADLVESVVVPHIRKFGRGAGGTQRALFILDGTGSHKGPTLKTVCAL